MKRFAAGLLLLFIPVAGRTVDTTVLVATARLEAANPPFEETDVTVKGKHEGQIVSLNQGDEGYTWIISGTLRDKGLLIWSEVDTCARTAGAQAVRSQTCETVWPGRCGKTYESIADTQINYPFLLGPGPADSDSTEARPLCDYASGPLNPLTNSCRTASCTPIVINLDGRGFRFTNIESGVHFDVDADGEAERLAWTAPNGRDAFLVLDRNGNGRIDDGTELFGGVTPQPPAEEANGFAALAVFDEPASGGNGDGVISAADNVFAQLGLWIDANHDAVSQGAEMTLTEEGIQAIDLTPVISQRRDRYGNRSKWASHVVFLHGLRLAAVDVIFLVE